MSNVFPKVEITQQFLLLSLNCFPFLVTVVKCICFYQYAICCVFHFSIFYQIPWICWVNHVLSLLLLLVLHHWFLNFVHFTVESMFYGLEKNCTWDQYFKIDQIELIINGKWPLKNGSCNFWIWILVGM